MRSQNSSFSVSETFAESLTATYAKAFVGCTLYKSSSLEDDISNIYFIIPETYFVMIISEVSETCFKVQYLSFVGYVKSESVEIATFTPIVKFLENITCDIKETSGTQIWTIPSASGGEILTTISAGTTKINYIAYAYGTIPSGGESNLWYYVSYTPSNNSTNYYEGYIYSENTTNLSEIIANTEVNPEEIVTNDEVSSEPIVISSSLKTLIIAIISIPVILLFAIILYKFVKKIKENTILKKNSEINENENSSFFREENHYEQKSKLQRQLDDLSHTSFVRKRNQNSYGRHYGSSSTDVGSRYLSNNSNSINSRSSHSFETNSSHSNGKRKSKNNYPDFPTYSGDDDLL